MNDLITLPCPRPACGADVLVDVTFKPGTPDVWYMPNGDPGYPGDPPYICITRVLKADCGHELNEADLWQMEEKNADQIIDDFTDRMEAAYEQSIDYDNQI